MKLTDEKLAELKQAANHGFDSQTLALIEEIRRLRRATERIQEYVPHFTRTCPELHCARSGEHLEDCDSDYCMSHGCELQHCTCGREAHVRKALGEGE